MSSEVEPNMTETTRQSLLLFECADQRCALRLSDVQEVIAVPALSTPLGTPRILDGFFTLEGQPVPVIRLALLFEMKLQPPQLHTPLILVKAADGCVALRVTSVLEIADIAEADVQPLLDQQIASGSAMIDGCVVAILDVDRLFHARERAAIKELSEIERERLAALQEVAA